MDLISIRRKYRNIKYIIIGIFILTLCILLMMIIKEIHDREMYEKIYISYSKQYEELKIYSEILEQQRIEEQKRLEEEIKKAKLPTLTEEGKANLANLYKSEPRRVFLTFDDGPSQTVTPVILDTLKAENIKATFFVLGSRVELNPSIVKREYEDGHYIASHGYSHVYSQIYSSSQAVIDEYNKTLTSIRNAIGEPEYNPHLFRYPGGYYGGRYYKIKQEAAVLLEQNNIAYIDWNALTADAAGNTTQEQFIAELEKTVPKHNTIVALMHDAGGKKATAESLPQIIAYFRERGFEFDNFYSVIK